MATADFFGRGSAAVMFSNEEELKTALNSQVSLHIQGELPPVCKASPYRLLLCFPDDSDTDGWKKYVKLNSIELIEEGKDFVVLKYDGWEIPYIYVNPFSDNYEYLFRKHLLSRLILDKYHDVFLTGRAVDHVFPRQQAKKSGIRYVLLLPCDRTVNSAHGGGIEKRMTSFDPVESKVYHADFTTLFKIAGMMPPSIAKNISAELEASEIVNELISDRDFAFEVNNEFFYKHLVSVYLRFLQTGKWGEN